jgi:hypothetical protein
MTEEIVLFSATCLVNEQNSDQTPINQKLIHFKKVKVNSFFLMEISEIKLKTL